MLKNIIYIRFVDNDKHGLREISPFGEGVEHVFGQTNSGLFYQLVQLI